MSPNDKPLVWLHGEVKTPPLSVGARQNVGYLLRLLQQGVKLIMPQSRSMSFIGVRCHELRIVDGDSIWRVVYRIDPDAIVILDVFQKKTNKTPNRVIQNCQKRLRGYDDG